MLLAHWDGKEHRAQSLKDHSENVARIMEENCFSLGLTSTGRLIGLLHDAGKANPVFQQYMLENQTEKKGKINHSAAGAQILRKLFFGTEFWIIPKKQQQFRTLLFQLCSIAILGHHRGLMDIYDPNGNSPFERMLNAEENQSVHDSFFNESNCKEEINQLIEKAQNEIIQLNTRINILVKGHSFEINDDKHKEAKLEEGMFTYGLIERFLFSSLIDSDRLDTACFLDKKNIPVAENRIEIWTELQERLNKELLNLEKLNPSQASSTLNQIRKRVSKSCLNAGNWPSGIYRLQSITGSGKTLASLRLALQHACNFPETKHIIYVIPFLSILLQNSQTIKETLHLEEHSDWILEHYSDFENELINASTDDNLQKQEELQEYELRTERWDSPIIITSLVHFMDTFFSARKKDVRRLHQLSNSVIIFDEIQSIPDNCIGMFNSALNMLEHLADVKVVLCSATPPLLEKIKHPLQWSQYKDIDTNYSKDMKKIHRVFVTDKTDVQNCLSVEKIAELAYEKQQERSNALTIMNTVSGATRVFECLKKKFEQIPEMNRPLLILLTTNLCPDHKKRRIQQMINALKENIPVLCVSTSLIEAGVDISFDVVLRACSGLDSLIQAAGRCNRHDHKKLGELIVFYSYEIDFMHESITKNTTVSQLTRKLICSHCVLDKFKKAPEDFENNILSNKALEMYYSRYYEIIQDRVDYPVTSQGFTLYDLNSFCSCWQTEISKAKKSGTNWMMHQAFETAGRYFKVIEDYSIGVLVPYEKGRELIEELNSGNIKFQPDNLRKLKCQAQNYSVNLNESYIRKHKQNFSYFEAADLYCLKEGCYDEEKGVTDFEAQSWII